MKDNRFLIRYRWLISALLYALICVDTFFNTTTQLDGVVMSRLDAGLWGLFVLHFMVLVAVAGAFTLHYLIEGFNWVFKKLFK